MEVATDSPAVAAMAMEQPAPLQQRAANDGDASQQCALVPFSFRNPFHDALRDAERRFPIADAQIRIRQGWKNDGKGGTAIGFGASVYDAAIALSLYLDAHRDAVLHKRVIELGCGPGLVGIVAGHLDAGSVVITDGDPASVQLTAENIQLNKLDETQCHAEQYLWGDTATAQAIVDAAPYDVILGADIIACPYVEAFAALLEAFLHLSDANTELLLAYKQRHGSESAFFDEFEKHFVVARVPTDHLHVDFQQSGIVLFRARRREEDSANIQ